MKKMLCGLLAFAMASALTLDCALAKRMGSGSSFGSRPSYSRSYTPSSPSGTGTTTAPSSPSQSRQASPTQQPTPMAPTQSPGLFSRMGWGMGGFLAGGLIGSMLFGHGGWGMGGGGGVGLLDILLIGLIVYFGFRLLRGRSAANVPGPRNLDPRDLRPDPHARAEQSWDNLRSQPQERSATQAEATTGGFGVAPGSEAPSEPNVPQGFSIPDFLEGAKTVYARLQHSWDRRDLNDIALFTTSEVFTEIKRQAAADPTPSKTELLLVNARMVEFREEEADTVASVLFDVLLREDASEDRPKQIREVWHFSRPTGNLDANWRLEGIQQLEV